MKQYVSGYVTTVVVCIAVTAILFLPLPVWANIAIAFVFGLVAFALRERVYGPLDDTSAGIADRYARPVMPRLKRLKDDVWKTVAGVVSTVIVMLPLLLLTLLPKIPPGDAWPRVIARISVILVFVVAVKLWFRPAALLCERVFRSRVPEDYFDILTKEDRFARESDTAASVWEAARVHWRLLAVSVVAALVFFKVVDFDSNLLDIPRAPRSAKRLVSLFVWCRQNPNTVSSSALIVGVGSMCVYVYRLGVGWNRNQRVQTRRETTPDDRAE